MKLRFQTGVCALLMIILCLSGCKSNSKDNGKGSGGYDRYDTTVEFTTVYKTVTGNTFPQGYSASQNPYWDYIYNELNIKSKFSWEASDYDAKLLLDIAANQLPDVFMVYDYDMYVQLYQADMIEDLTEYYDEYASEKMKSYYKSYGEDVFTYVTEDGSLMALPQTQNGYQQSLLWLRKDWLDALNLQVPQTVEEIEKTALAFINQDPGGNGVGNTYGLLINREHCFQGYRNSYGLEPIANSLGSFPKQWMADNNGKVYYGSVTPEFKKTLELTRSWVEKGVINPKLFEMGWEQIWGLVTNGQAGMWFYPCNWGDTAEFYEKNPRAEVVCVNAPLDAQGKATYATGAPFEGVLVVRKGFKNPEIIFKIWDLYTDMDSGELESGYEALTPFREEGSIWYAYAPFGSFKCVPYDTNIQTGKQLKAYVDSGGKTVPKNVTKYTIETYWNKALDWVKNKDSSENHAYYNNNYMAANVLASDIGNPVKPVYFFNTASMLEYWVYLESMENDTVRTILTGENSIDTFDAFVADWMESGGSDIIAEVQSIYDEKFK